MGIMAHLAAAEFERRVQARARVKDMADRVGLLDRLALLRLLEEREELALRVAELEAERGEPTGTEWGVRHPDGYAWCTTEQVARAYVEATHPLPARGELVNRTAPGPWREAT